MKYSSLMGVFPSTYSPPSTKLTMVNMISSTTENLSKGKEIAPIPSLSLNEAMYDAIQTISDAYIDDHHLVASDPYHLPYWLDSPLPTLDYLSQNFPSNKSIMEVMSLDESSWEDSHH